MLGEFHVVPQKITPIIFLSAELFWHQSLLVAVVGAGDRAGVPLGGQHTAVGQR
jgi:hypothetical protein